MTGEFLYQASDWISFYNKIINQESSLNSENSKKLKNNQYLIDFLEFVLIKNPLLRPNIDTVIKRFEAMIESMGII